MQAEQNVLVVDEAEAVRSFIRTVLVGMGVSQIECVECVEKAMTCINQSDFNIAFIDTKSVQGEGNAILPLLLSRCPTCKVVYCADTGVEQHVRQALEDGVSGYLIKPVTASNLTNVMARLG